MDEMDIIQYDHFTMSYVEAICKSKKPSLFMGNSAFIDGEWTIKDKTFDVYDGSPFLKMI
ncbi:Aldehyde/histidinol dehydrogenase [Penicillium canescens]|uniref:Aldehyde/histidinol dehydrogenase n=1 Tax=Penicillium canescens TaxID=5083 RepID=A0AAD6N3W9_PENCN|nr:Aldehyde/histidinol dehydrogenase [Penicillium canescens]KAJ6008915.1 Aldehyde/histidinol dehydrogenase [Penicillium canescens]KAJ6027580.1 Aldehyde/histidinol dehydrogenase [Penicillium canescens]KAJ6040859.1 Aldehyde/histidinol dehydrogenase [Penicillium canescens]KAJ6066788.1 Aldehyde/histidinol dehydrogenase [Penicillium canescens]KAJ6101406.1 Aldehyde/histidinol dehydrogenase [Penicillium canescens]